jgi:signal transduction histidine kinase
MRIWDLNSACAATSLHEPDVVCAVVSPDEKSLYMCGGKGMATRRLDAAPSVPSRKIPLPDNVGGRSLSVSLDGRWAAVALRDYRLFSIDLTGKMAPVEMQGRYRSVSFRGAASVTGSGRYAISPDGRWIVTGNDFNGDNPQVWDARSGQLAARLNASTSVVGFSADGQRLGLAGREQSSIWSVGDWKLIKVFPRDEPSLVNGALAFAQGHSLLATERTRQSVQLRNGNTFDKLADLISPTVQSVNSLRVASDGSTLATSTPGGMVEIWRLNDLRRQLAAMGLDWGSEPVGPDEVPQGDSGSSRITIILVMATFMLAATLILLTLRRHRVAIERFVTAEAQAAQQDRELNAAKVELVRSQKMQALGTLAVGIAHDFNNLLSVVRMSSKLIGRQAGDSRDIQEHVADIEHAVLQGKQVVSSMLGYARPGHAMGEPTDASAVVADTVSLLSKEFLSGITLILEQAPAAPKVRLDRGPLEQILLNLVVNASEAMQGAGKLKITVRACLTLPSHDYVLQPGKAEGYVEMSVIDTGPGISPDIRDRLFEPFFTTKRSSARVGTGLGLSLVYSIARQNELGLAVESEPGRGAMFCLVMPVVPNGVRETHTAPQARNV